MTITPDAHTLSLSTQAALPDVQSITLNVQVKPCISYASWQNSVSLIDAIEVCNATNEPFEGLRLEMETFPAIARKKNWMIERIAAGDSLPLHDRDVQLDPKYLNGLNEAERCVLTFRLLNREKTLTEISHDIRVLARDEWGGMSSMADLLAAFVMPNDPALAGILKKAGDVLQKHGYSSALDGYQSREPSRAYLVAAAIWSAIASKSLTYAHPPKSFETIGQKTRRPSTVLTDGLATCLDSTLLFAAALEAAGLNPVIIMTEGHCFVGAWLVEKTFNRLVETDCSEIRKAIAAREVLTFETTMVTHKPAAMFKDAITAAKAATSESREAQFVGAIDIVRARMAQILPLASHDTNHFVSEPVEERQVELPLPAVPSFGSLAIDVSEETPTTPAGRIERWQRKLLDLSLRNRLLNFRPTKQTVPVICTDLCMLEDRLAEGAKLKLISLWEHDPIGIRDSEIHRQKTNQDLQIEFAREALDRNEVTCPLDSKDLTSRLTALYRTVRNDLAEGGSNTLFLAVGFLKWKRPEDFKSYRAPLLLVPVKLERRSALSAFHLVHHEDEVRFNATLIQLLKKDFARDISFLENNLPKDSSGIDVPLVLEKMRREVRDIPGFEVVDELALSTFSFAKYLMWKDLVDRVDQLIKNRVVRHLIQNPDKPFQSEGSGSIPRSYEIDTRFEPKDIYHPLPADSSQLAAVMAASEGQDYVLIGPPGTGKSQTIANIVSQCLAAGKTVLFVAEKTAALDVVYRRLREHGLGDCCLELHSNRAERRKFLDQLQASWQNNRRAKPSDWLTISERLKVRRDELNSYVAAIHVEHANGWSVYRGFGVSVRGKSQNAPTLNWPPSVQHDRSAYESLTKLVEKLARTYQAIDPGAKISCVKVKEWSASWEAKLLAQCRCLRSSAVNLEKSLSTFLSGIGITQITDCSLLELESLDRLAKALIACAGEDVRVLFHKQFVGFSAAAKELQQSIERYHDANKLCAGIYEDAVLDSIPLDELDQSWRIAVAAFWPKSWFAKRKVTRLLQTYATGGAANPATDIGLIRTRREQLAVLAANPMAGQTPHWRGLDTDINGLTTHLREAGELRQAIVNVGQPLGVTNQICKLLTPALSGRSRELPIYASAQTLVAATESFLACLREFAEISGRMPLTKNTAAIITETVAVAAQIEEQRVHLQRWTAWCDIKEKAEVAGLQPFLVEMEAGSIQPADLLKRFELAYARWWLPQAIDRSAVLRSFQRFKHEDAIEDFRKLDDIARQAASSRAREAIAHSLPSSAEVPRKSELGLLRHQMGLQRPSKSIREIIAGMPESFGKLAPCLLMSPLSISQYLPASQALFDVVIFDEASQITTWDAIGAIARGRQTIIVGDPKQLPPTNFFGRNEDDEENDELEDCEKDLESILDESQASGLPTLQLNWHYRSRHESLIAFSNWNYYGNNLVTFPAAESSDRGVSFQHRPDTVYDRGKSRTNRKEAEAIVEDAVARMKRCLELPEEDRLTFGVITFNSQQQSLIQDLFDNALQDHPELEWYFAEERIEPTAVKNLENVQGDERDVMFFSITFGPDQAGKLPLTFGALNRDGGERRLNVAVTRARVELIVYSSFKGDVIAAERSGKRGVLDLKGFLEYAEKGPIAIAARSDGSVGGFESPFEEAVAEALVCKGWQVTPQVGVSGFRVDLGIVHPDKPGAFLAGVECDGATYHRSAVARDRDKTRQQVLNNLGWNIIRIWSPDWWYDPASALARVDNILKELLRTERERK